MGGRVGNSISDGVYLARKPRKRALRALDRAYKPPKRRAVLGAVNRSAHGSGRRRKGELVDR